MASSDTPAHSYFASLLEQSRKLREDTEAADLPPIQLGLGEIERRAKELKKARPGARSDTRAHYLLAAGGVNADEALRNLDAIDAQTSYEPSHALLDTDLESYLKSRKEQNIMTSIEDGMQRTSRDFDAYVAKNVTMEWDQEKARIFEYFGLYPKSEGGANEFGNSTFGASQFGRTVQGRNGMKGSTYGSGSVWATSMGSSILGKPQYSQSTTTSFFPDVDSSRIQTTSRPIQVRHQRYATVVRRLNEARLQGAPFPIMRRFGEASASSGGDKATQQVTDAWSILERITNESGDGSPFNEKAGERHYAKLHINVKPDSAEATQLKKLVELGGRKYLESAFFKHVEKKIEEKPSVSRLGGIPTVTNKFKAYYNCLEADSNWSDKHFDKNADNVPVWALVFYMIRGGFVKEAAAYVKENHQFFQKLDRSFHQYIAAYAKDTDRRIPRSLSDRIQIEHTQLLRDAENVDMFRIALYKIIGRCELSKRSLSDVLTTTEDWMWLQLVLTRETERAGEPAHEVFQLGDLQKSVLQFGAKHFNGKTSSYGMYFQMLLMSGLFEHAIQYLYSFQPIDAVHFAIALTYYGLLGVASTTTQRADSNLLVNGPLGDYQINFARMIGQYVRQFRPPTVEDSVDYLCLICLNGDLPAPDGPTQLSLCHEALRQISLESPEIKTLLGNVDTRGVRTKGVIYKRMKLVKIADHEEFLRTIYEQAAVQADDDGRFQDAVLLYDLAEDYDTVVQVLNKCISDWIFSESSQPDNTLANSDRPQEDAKSITEIQDPPELGRVMLANYMGAVAMYKQISPRNREALMVLLRISEAKRMFQRQDHEGCLAQIEKLDVIPMEPGVWVGDQLEVDVGTIRQIAQNFGSLHDAVARNVGMLLKLAVECCYVLALRLRESPFNDLTKRQKIEEYRGRVKGAMIYAGMVQYKLPSNVYEFLALRSEKM